MAAFIDFKNGLRNLKILNVLFFSFLIIPCSSACDETTIEVTPINPFKLRVMTYNIGTFSGVSFTNGSEEGAQIIRQALSEQDCDIVGLQEDDESFGNKNPGEAIYNMYPYYYRTGSTVNNYKAFASRFPISNVKQIFFKNNYYHHPFFLVGEVCINENSVLLASFHLDWADNSRRRLQIDQLIEYASVYRDVILMGDTNCLNYVDGNRVTEDILYRQEWSLFIEKGYSCANNGAFGLFSTTSLGKPLDNIFVKGNIKITNAWSVIKDYMNDHYMLCADLVVY